MVYCHGVHFSIVMNISLKPELPRLPAAVQERSSRVSRPTNGNYKKRFFLSLYLRVLPNRLWQLILVTLSHEHPSWDKNPWFIPLSETINIPDVWESPPPPSPRHSPPKKFLIQYYTKKVFNYSLTWHWKRITVFIQVAFCDFRKELFLVKHLIIIPPELSLLRTKPKL